MERSEDTDRAERHQGSSGAEREFFDSSNVKFLLSVFCNLADNWNIMDIRRRSLIPKALGSNLTYKGFLKRDGSLCAPGWLGLLQDKAVNIILDFNFNFFRTE